MNKFDLPGDGPNPAPISLTVTSGGPTVVPPVSAPTTRLPLYMPRVGSLETGIVVDLGAGEFSLAGAGE
jgi:hypothetical protein